MQPNFFPDSIIYKEKSSSWMILTHVDRQLSTACYMPACSFSHFVKVFCHSIPFNRWDSTITHCGTSVTSHRSKDALKTLLLWNRTKYVYVYDYVSLLQETLLKDFSSQLLHMWFRSHQLLGANFHAAVPLLANVQNVCRISIMFSINQLIYGHLKRVGQATCTSEGPFLPAPCLQ